MCPREVAGRFARLASVALLVALTAVLSPGLVGPVLGQESVEVQVVWATYIGGEEGEQDEIFDMTLDDEGNVYVVGQTEANDLPRKTNEPETSQLKAYVAKLDPSGAILWTTYVSGSEYSNGTAVAVDQVSGDIYITGLAVRGDVPLTGSTNEGEGVFVSELDSEGNIQWTVFLTNGSPFENMGTAVALDTEGQLYVTGTSNDDTLLPGVSERGGGGDAFLAKMGPSGDIVWTGYVGGPGQEIGSGLALDREGNMWLAGQVIKERSGSTYSLPNAVNQWSDSDSSGFVTKFSPSGEIEWSLFLGGREGISGCSSLTVDASGDAYVGGTTDAEDLNPPLTNSCICRTDTESDSCQCLQDGFFSKIDGEGNVIWSTYVAATQALVGAGDLAVTDGDVLGLVTGSGDGLILMDAATGATKWYEGGNEDPGLFRSINHRPDSFQALALGPEGHVYLAGRTVNEELPNRTNDYGSGTEDAFVAKLAVPGFGSAPPPGTTEPEPQATVEPTPAKVGLDIPIEFGAMPETVAPGECAVLFWSVPEGDWTITFDGQEVPGDVEWQVCPESTRSYELLVEGPGGSKTVTVTVAVIGVATSEPRPEPETEPSAQPSSELSLQTPPVVPGGAQVEDACRPGRLAYEQQDFEQAVTLFIQCIARDHEYLGRSYYFRDFSKDGPDRFEAARSELEKALALDPNNAGVYDFLGRIHFFLDDYDQAWVDLEKANQLNPELPDPYHLRGFIAYERGEYGQAVPLLQKYLQFGGKANEANAYEYLGRAFYGLREYEQAGSHLEKAVQLNPELTEAPYFLGMILYRQKDYERALPWFQRSRDLGADDLDAQVWTQLGWTHHRLEQYQEAEQAFLQAISLDQTNPNTYGGLGAVYYRMGDCSRSIPMYEKAIELAPDFQGWRDGLARCRQ